MSMYTSDRMVEATFKLQYIQNCFVKANKYKCAVNHELESGGRFCRGAGHTLRVIRFL